MTAAGALLRLAQMVKLGRIAILPNVARLMPLRIIAEADVQQSRHSTTLAAQSRLHQTVHGVGLGMATWKSPKAKPWLIAWIMDMIAHRALGPALNNLASPK